MSLTELIEGFGKQTLKPTTTVVKHLPVDVEQLEKVNPALARFYMENLMPPPAPAAVSFVIANTFKALPPKSTPTASDLTYYDWTLSVNFLDATQLKYIDSVVFDLHPTFSPPSIHMSARSASQQQAASSSSSSSSASPADSGCFSLRRKGWGVFKIGITICDIFGKTYPFTHRLTFSNPDNAHEEQIQIALPAPSFSSSATSSSSAPSSSSATSSSAPSSSATSSSSSSPSSSSPSSSSAGSPSAVPIRRMTGVEEGSMHGALGVGKGWAAPYLVTFCDEEARPGYRSMKAHEYNEDPVTLRQKVRVLASLLKRAKHCVTYTGAGISTASGIDDYASKAKDSLATGTGAIGARPKRKTGLDAEPTFAHYVLAALHRAGMVKHWVQQNHDGLPQKAGFPQEAINEIHGAWFDPSNPVVPMEGSLRGDLFSWLRREEQAADLVLTMGTSLCGMNADRMVSTAGKKALHKKQGLGSVIIGFQQTQLDHLASLRIFAKIDEVMLLLAWELQLEVPVQLYTPDIPPAAIVRPHVYRVPYDSQGRLATDGKTTTLWDLSVGAPLMLTDGPGKGFRGVVARTPASATAHYSVQFPCTREGKHLGQGLSLYAFGSWWIEACTKGKVDVLPVINVPRST